MIETSSDLLWSSSAILGNLRKMLENLRKMVGNLRNIITFSIIKRKLHGRLEIRNLSSRVEKYFSLTLRSLVKYFSTLEDNFRISAGPCNNLYFYPDAKFQYY